MRPGGFSLSGQFNRFAGHFDMMTGQRPDKFTVAGTDG